MDGGRKGGKGQYKRLGHTPAECAGPGGRRDALEAELFSARSRRGRGVVPAPVLTAREGERFTPAHLGEGAAKGEP